MIPQIIKNKEIGIPRKTGGYLRKFVQLLNKSSILHKPIKKQPLWQPKC